MKKIDPYKELFITVLFFVIPFLSNAQFNNTAFDISSKIDTANSNSISLGVNNANFFKNNEYFNQIVQGYTLIGYHLQLRAEYQPIPNLKLEAGVHLQKYSGLKKFTQVLPVFRVNYQPLPWMNIVMGTLYGTTNHHMIDPLFDFERYYKDNVEDGGQLLIDHKRIRTDFWLSWEQFIFEHSTYQEQFVGGNSSQWNIVDTSKKVLLEIPVGFLFAHKGGQSLNVPNHQIQTLFNLDYGIHFGINFHKKIMYRLVFKGYVAHYMDVSPEKMLPYKKGIAFYPSLSLEAKYFDVMMAYWDGNKFIAPRGEPFYQSVAEDDSSTYTENNRQLITMKVAVHYKISVGIDIGARFEGYYDLHNKIFDYSYGLYILFNRDFLLKKFGEKKNKNILK